MKMSNYACDKVKASKCSKNEYYWKRWSKATINQQVLHFLNT